MKIDVRDVMAIQIKRYCDKRIGTKEKTCPTIRANELIAKGLKAEKEEGKLNLYA